MMPHSALVFDNPNSSHDIIMGLDLLHPLGIDPSPSTQTVQWQEHIIPFKPHGYYNITSNMLDSLAILASPNKADETSDMFNLNINICYNCPGPILESKYEKVDVKEVAEQQTHLTESQRQDLTNLLSKYTKLFSGQLGKYEGHKVHLELELNA